MNDARGVTLWGLIEELVVACGGSAADFPEELTNKISDIVDGMAGTGTRGCTCHPDDNPPRPCPRKFALTECRAARGASVLQAPRWCDFVSEERAKVVASGVTASPADLLKVAQAMQEELGLGSSRPMSLDDALDRAAGVVVDHGLNTTPVVDHEAANLSHNADGVPACAKCGGTGTVTWPMGQVLPCPQCAYGVDLRDGAQR